MSQDQGRVDDADFASGLGQVQGNGKPVATGGFQAGVEVLRAQLTQPSVQIGKAFGVIEDGFAVNGRPQ